MTDPTEPPDWLKLADAIRPAMCCADCAAQHANSQGFGHQSDILRAFAEWVRTINPAGADILDIYIRDYLASLAAKGEEG